MSRPTITVVAACDLNGVIGNSDTNRLPWPKMGNDLQRFKEATMGKAVIMGRKTWESLPRRPLPGRRNIVMTRDIGYLADGAEVFYDVDSVLNSLTDDACVIGGEAIYRQWLPYSDSAIITRIMGAFDGDVRFPFDVMREGVSIRDCQEFEVDDKNPYKQFVFTFDFCDECAECAGQWW